MKSMIFATLFIPTSSIVFPSKDCFQVNTRYNHGQPLAIKKNVVGPNECQKWCQLVRRCTSFSYNSSSQTCHLSRYNRSQPKFGFTSGPKHCPASTVNQLQVKPVCSGTICLGGSTSTYAGHVMVDDKPVCDDDWGLEDAAVVCRQLGFPGVERATKESEFGRVTSSYKMDNVGCFGNETDLMDCSHKDKDDCDGNEAAGVVCSTSTFDIPEECKEDDKICLLGGSSGSGNVYYEGKPVCQNGWDFPDAHVVCKALGYSGASNFTIRSHFGLSSTYFSFSNVNCRGDEEDIMECPHDFEREGCEADTVAGVVCMGSGMEKVDGKGKHLEIVLGVSLAAFVLILVVVLAVIGRFRNKKMVLIKNASRVFPRISFQNPIIRSPDYVDMNEQL